MCGSCHILRKTTKFQISSTAPLGVCVSTTPTQIGVASQLKSHKKERVIPILGNYVHLETTGFQLAFRTTVLAMPMLVSAVWVGIWGLHRPQEPAFCSKNIVNLKYHRKQPFLL